MSMRGRQGPAADGAKAGVLHDSRIFIQTPCLTK